MENVRDKVRQSLTEYFNVFDTENRGNRISREIVAGLAGFLEDLIVNIVKQINTEEGKKDG